MTTVSGRAPATGGSYLVCEIDYSVAGTVITLTYRVRTVLYGWSDAQVLTLGNSIAESIGYTASAPSNATQTLYETTRTFTGSRGSSYTFSAAVSGAFNGWAPSVAVTVAIPAIAPSAPGAPVATLVTGSSARLTWAAPADEGGAAVTSYTLQWDNEPTFTSPNSIAGNLDRTHDVSGLTPGDSLYSRVYATNAAGTSAASGVTTTPLLDYPDGVAAPTFSAVGSTTATAAWVAPASDGGSPVTGYNVRRSTDPGMAGASTVAVAATPRTLALSGLTPGGTYYVDVQPVTAVGVGPRSPAGSFTTLAGFKVYNGSAFVPKPPQVFNGSAFVPKVLKRWNGTAWEVAS